MTVCHWATSGTLSGMFLVQNIGEKIVTLLLPGILEGIVIITGTWTIS